MILLLCLVLAVMSVLLVPLLVGGAAPQTSAPVSSSSSQTTAACGSLADAAAIVGFAPRVPGVIPEGYEAVAYRVLDGETLEIEYSTGKNKLIYRTAEGSEDLSGVASNAYGFTATLGGADGVTRGYAGFTDRVFATAVWVDGDYSFALLAPDGLDAQLMARVAESVH